MENYNKTINKLQERIKNLNESKDKLLETIHKIGDEITYDAQVINLFAYHQNQIGELINDWCNQLLIKKLNFFILFLTKIDNFLE